MKVKDIVSIDQYDPLDLDISAIQKLSEQIPSGNIDAFTADELSSKFLSGAELCSSMLAQISRYCGYCESQVRQAKADAIVKLTAEKVSVTVLPHRYGNDVTYLTAKKRFVDALAVQEWLQRKYDNLIRAHYHMRNIAKQSVSPEGDGADRPQKKSGPAGSNWDVDL